ncbi:hypothetical protein [uncultured Arenimonas sp.]|uniref:hypothetical protein n=1 Tax=uncultured Arenimonas sp. TaxID=546226 RepID=UPI0030DAB229
MTDLSLVKDTERTLVSPAVPAQPAIGPVPFRMYAPPLPLGWRYKAYTLDGETLLPNSAATFNTWPTQLYQPQEFTTSGESSYEFMTLAEFTDYLDSLGVNSISFEQATPVYEGDDLIGYRVWVPAAGEPELVDPKFWAPLDFMEYVTFPDVATEGAYGYPTGEGMFRGYFDVPTAEGVERVWGNYWKDFRGVLLRLPVGSDPLPALCTQRDSTQYNPARVVVLANFPGRSATPGQAAQYHLDGNPGWNSGATSIDAFDGDCRVSFTPVVTAALAVGLTASPRPSVVDVNGIEFAFRFDQPAGGGFRYYVAENGQRMTSFAQAAADAVFVIERINGAIAFKVNDTLVYEPQRLSAGPLCVGSALYFGGDGVY